jgi:tRNA nucleotidyltransferase (CCA-adding enzyme)
MLSGPIQKPIEFNLQAVNATWDELNSVSDAFVEDPVRVLRVARFIARFHHLGFTLAPETRQLMQRMVREGELAHLVAERVWQEWQQSLVEPNPECFITTLRDCGGLSVVLPEIDALFGVPNSRDYHPEVDTGVHSLRALVIASRLSPDPLVRFAAFLHDLGKTKTPMQFWPSHPGQSGAGLDMIQQLCQRLRIPTRYQQCARMAIRWHGQIHRLRVLSAEEMVDVLDKIAAFRDSIAFERLLLVCEADYKGRSADNPLKSLSTDYQFSELWRIILAKCATLTAATWVEQGLVGEAIKHALYQARVACVKALVEQWESNEIKR